MADVFGAATYGAAFAAAQRLSGAGKYAIAAALIWAMSWSGSMFSPIALGGLSDALGGSRQALLLWSALAIVAAITLLLVRATIQRRVAEAES